MSKGAAVAASLAAGLVLYLLAWPVPVDPVAWHPPEDQGLTGVHAPNDLLAPARGIDLGDYHGPEDIALGRDGFLYATTLDGTILKVSPSGRTVVPFVNVGGRPLGIESLPDGSLVVANAILGLQHVDPDGAVSNWLTHVGGEPLRYADDVAVADDGTVYLTEASTKFGAAEYRGTLEASLLDLLEHGGHGLVVAYRPDTGTARVLIDGLNFANGIAVSDDQQYLLVAETGAYRILKHWLDGPLAGRTEVLLDNLPGFPDNINNGEQGRFWIGLPAPRNALLDTLAPRPFVRRIVQRLPAFLRPAPVASSHVIAIDGEGTVLMDLQDAAGRYPMLTGVLESPAALYLSTLTGHRLPWLDKDELL